MFGPCVRYSNLLLDELVRSVESEIHGFHEVLLPSVAGDRGLTTSEIPERWIGSYTWDKVLTLSDIEATSRTNCLFYPVHDIIEEKREEEEEEDIE